MNEHESGLPNAIDRAVGHPEQQSVVFHGTRRFIQKGELNELQTIIRGRHDRLGRLVAKEGDRIERADAIVDHDGARVTLLAGKIYVAGDIFPVEEAVLENVPMTGRTEIGVKLSRKWVTSEDDPELLGQEPGSLAEGEPGAARETISIAWALSSSDNDGEFFPVYVLLDGTILDQKGPSLLEPAMQAIATYDRAHGHYVVSGCRVTALGADAGRQIFSIEEGEANISGFKRTRKAALRYAEAEDWDEAAVPGETHTYPGGDRYTFAVDLYPIGVIRSILLTKEKTVSVTRGAVSAGQDGLPDNSVVSIIQVRQGSKIYVEGKDYIRTGNTVDWAPVGDEPAPGSSYEVTYRYRDSVTADEHNDRDVTVSVGAAGGDIIISYTYKMPRIDRIGLQMDGAPVYIKGISASANPMPPIVPEDVLSLATITNNWMDKPAVKNDAYRSIPYAELQRFCDRLGDLDRLLQLERLKSGIDSREPVAKKGMFVDPFLDHSYRDAGSPQTAAVGRGIIELPITSTFYHLPLDVPVTLDWEEDIIVRQELITACTKINPYANFAPLPVDLSLNPAADFWTERRTDWAEGVTNDHWVGGRTRGPLEERSTADELVSQRQEQIQFLRQIDVNFEIRKLGKGEVLESLTFDDIDVKPEGDQAAGSDGIITGTFKIPENVPSGTKEIIARTKAGSNAVAMFTGQGTIEVDVMRRVTTVRRWWRVKADPQAQVFMPDQPRQIVGVDFHLCKLGDPKKGLLIEQVTTDNGYPTTDIIGQASFDMTAAPPGWASARYGLPVTTPADGLSAFVIKTDDNEHSISLAKLGEFDEEKQQWVTSHPYVIGPRFSAVNAETWTAHQDEALAFRIVAARYPVTTKTIDLGSIDLTECSDLQVRAAVELPSADCSVVFEVERTNGTVYRLLPMQILQLTEYVTETVKLRAVLKGTEFLSPILYAPVEVIAGKIATDANYISKAFKLGENVRVAAYIKAYLPGGTTFDMSIKVDQSDWQQLPLEETDELAEPLWTERKFELKNLTGHQAQLQIKITGSPAARVVAGDFGAGIF